MDHRDEARAGASIAGTLLCAMPVLDVIIGLHPPGPVHLLVALFGATLIGVSGKRP